MGCALEDIIFLLLFLDWFNKNLFFCRHCNCNSYINIVELDTILSILSCSHEVTNCYNTRGKGGWGENKEIFQVKCVLMGIFFMLNRIKQVDDCVDSMHIYSCKIIEKRAAFYVLSLTIYSIYCYLFCCLYLVSLQPLLLKG